MLPWGLPLRVVKNSQQGRPEHRSVVLASHFYRFGTWAGVWKCGLWEGLCQHCSLCPTPAFLPGVRSLGICRTETVFMTSPKQRAWLLCWVFSYSAHSTALTLWQGTGGIVMHMALLWERSRILCRFPWASPSAPFLLLILLFSLLMY